MCEIRRINKLKTRSRQFTESLSAIDPRDLYPLDHVSNTGLTFTDMSEKLDKIKSCSSIIELKSDFRPAGDTLEQVLTVSAANFCKQPAICPICADRTQARRRVRFDNPIKTQARLVAEGKRHAYIVTQTVTDGPYLAERLDALKEAKRNFRLMGQRRRKGKRSGGEAAKYAAAIAGIEIKRGSGSGLWHVHAHELVFTDEPLDFQVYDRAEKQRLKSQYGRHIPKEKLDAIALQRVEFRGELVAASKASAEWLKATGGESMGISIEPLQHVPKAAKGRKKRKYEKMSFEESIAYQAKEVLKYPFKPSDNSPEDAFMVISDTFNKRMVATYGEFRGIPAEEYANPAAPDDETFVLKWDDQKRKYGEPVPGKMRDLIEDEEAAHDTRSKAGKILGEYRRQRAALMAARDKYGEGLAGALDAAKTYFRRRICGVWSLYRQHVSSSNRISSAGCDKYSSVLALDGCFIPGSDSRDIYAAVFT